MNNDIIKKKVDNNKINELIKNLNTIKVYCKHIKKNIRKSSSFELNCNFFTYLTNKDKMKICKECEIVKEYIKNYYEYFIRDYDKVNEISSNIKICPCCKEPLKEIDYDKIFLKKLVNDKLYKCNSCKCCITFYKHNSTLYRIFR